MARLGADPWSFISTGAVKTSSIKTGEGVIHSLEFFNTGAAAVHIRLYDQAGPTAPATGDSANIIWRGTVPGNVAGAGVAKSWDVGIGFTNGLGIRVTGSSADNDNTSLSAGEIKGNIGYK